MEKENTKETEKPRETEKRSREEVVRVSEMKTVKDKEFGGERALFATKDLRLVGVRFRPGESALKCCSNIDAQGCRYEGKYPYWHVDGFRCVDCDFTEGARAALWYSRNLLMKDCRVEAPKMFREMEHLTLKNVTIPHAHETLWSCRDISLDNVEVAEADYIFMHCSDIEITNYMQKGNYSFQYCKNVVIRNARIESKDAFWETENVTVYDSEIDGEYLGWHSKNLRLVRCHINGIQPLCYAEGLVMEDCTMGDECILSFEDSDVQAQITTNIVSVKNPRTGRIHALSIGEVILDGNVLPPANCEITTEIGDRK